MTKLLDFLENEWTREVSLTCTPRLVKATTFAKQ